MAVWTGLCILVAAQQTTGDFSQWLQASLDVRQPNLVLPDMTDAIRCVVAIYLLWGFSVLLFGRGPRVRHEDDVVTLPPTLFSRGLGVATVCVIGSALVGTLALVSVHLTDASPRALMETWVFWGKACAWVLIVVGILLTAMQGGADGAALRAKFEDVHDEST